MPGTAEEAGSDREPDPRERELPAAGSAESYLFPAELPAESQSS